jgi:DNA (cytosine-5)-methyltransferase 1
MVNRTNNVPKSIEEPLAPLNTGGHLGLVQPVILPHRTFDNMTADSIEHPIRTVTAKGTPALVEPIVTEPGPAVLIPFNGEAPGQTPRTHSIEDPLPTITSGGAGQKGLAQSVLLKYNRTGGPRSTHDPLDTLTGKPRYGLVTPEILAKLDALPVGAVTPWGLKIAPSLYLDILFRMLRVPELAQGQGFPRDYRFTGTLEEQVKQIGNAVEVHQAMALCMVLLG